MITIDIPDTRTKPLAVLNADAFDYEEKPSIPEQSRLRFWLAEIFCPQTKFWKRQAKRQEAQSIHLKQSMENLYQSMNKIILENRKLRQKIGIYKSGRTPRT